MRRYRNRMVVGLAVCLVFWASISIHAIAQEAQPSPPAPPSETPAASSADTPAAVPTPAAESTPSPTPASQPEKEGAAKSAPRLTLWDMIIAGGVIMWVIILLSIATGIMAVYFLVVVTPAREIPPAFVKRAITQIRAGDLRGAYQMCEGRDELVANVLRAGLKVAGHDRYVIQEAMESEGERGATQLWEKISYLNYVGVTAPLLGLLGTVWGMINAFGAIAFEDAIVRGKAMASGVAQAMITTAGGLVVAIPAFVLYFYLRGRVIKIIAQMESLAGEMVEILSRSQHS
ncbi:MAG TPA: MotA/TolQ/ExbB proton channel family protein [Candidatus Hydrogenedentes bacterium]|nr:MotA/TolQ/ExbB proton channel family protein [Candidatus Hydrogenedentota bacterium]HOL75927.1 MotA/TolQ/ExbB proton channel family protein [Candidatus Hydrogenedentota bacterium]HPO85664.1 MotA/TolQ/ExbB proton channel family protein [Candidatus Hydrogenedentota bacterium]